MEHFSNLLHHPLVSLDRDLEASSHAAEPSLECSTDQGRTHGGGLKPPLELDVLRKLYYLRKGD